MPLTDDQSLLIACRAMNPFVNDPLLTKDPNGQVQPVAGIRKYALKQVLAELHQNDLDYGLHAVDHILDSLRSYCRDEDYSLAMGPNELLDGTLIKTAGGLADWVEGACSPLKGR